MTRNIIAEFSSSLYLNREPKQYQVVSGSVFNDEYSETLDSGTILLSHVTNDKRLTNIKPYDFCRVYDEASYNSDTGKYEFDHVYLVDNFNEKEDNIHEHLFSYTINLMSQTKLLEKIQCPNLNITHEVEDGKINKKTIFEKICEYMELFTPKVKMYNSSNDSWEYQPLIENPGVKKSKEYEYETLFSTYNTFIAAGTTSERLEKEIYGLAGKEIIDFSINVVNALDTLGRSVPAHITDSSFNSEEKKFYFKIVNEAELGQTTQTIVQANIRIEYTAFFTSKFYYYEQKEGFEDFYNKFNVPCADLGSSYYTLRTLLTVLMQQVRCIPSVRDLKLGFLDLADDAGSFDLNGDNSIENTVNYINKSLSSDSFVNTIVNVSGNVLDSGNVVVSEIIGFRDKNNVLLKQKENLVLETKFPIYKINKFEMNCIMDGTFLNSIYADNLNPSGWTTVAELSSQKSGNKINLTIRTAIVGTHTAYSCLGNSYGEINTYNYDAAQDKYIKIETQTFEYSNLSEGSVQEEISFNNNFDYYIVKGYVNTKVYLGQQETGWSAYASGFNTNIPATSVKVPVDITKLIKEESQRELLETDFTKIENAQTIDEFSKYIYGTVGYNIGSTRIFGFSSYYEQLQGRGDIFVYAYGKTYIENLYQFVVNHTYKETIAEILGEAFEIDIPIGLFDNISSSAFLPNDLVLFSSLTFNIEYQPLNSFNLSYVKREDDIDFSLEQLNNADSGLTDFDRLSLNQQESVDRIGNDTIFISQRLSPEQFKDGYLRGGFPFKPTYFYRDGQKYTIYKRTYTVGNYKYDVSYVGSRNAILKDYFTSIRTKYRAYQYVDYNQSTLRKEKDVIYVRLGEDYYNGDDKIYLKAGGYGISAFIDGIKDNSNKIGLKYACEESLNYLGNNEKIKNELSLISNDYSFALIYEQDDNISAGPYIANIDYTTYDYINGDEDDENERENYKLGGIPQVWQRWYIENYGDNHKVYFINNLKYYDTGEITYFATEQEVWEQLSVTAKAPIVTDVDIPETANVLYIVDDNTVSESELTRTFYKDLSERLNHTVQFIYYSTSPNIAWTENFIANNSFVNHCEYIPNKAYVSTLNNASMVLNKELHSNTSEYVAYPNDISNLVTVHNNRIEITWGNYNYIKICYDNGEGKVSDFIVFKKPEGAGAITSFYVSLNDTKSDYVLTKENGILFRRYKVRTNTNDRRVRNV